MASEILRGIIYNGRFLYEPLQVNRLPHIKSCVQLFYSYDLGLLYTVCVYIYIYIHCILWPLSGNSDSPDNLGGSLKHPQTIYLGQNLYMLVSKQANRICSTVCGLELGHR